MGSSGFSLELAKFPKRKRYGTLGTVSSEIVSFLRSSWSTAVPTKLSKQAYQWVNQGEESMVSLVSKSDDLDAPVTKISFWFYDSVSWPVELANHWIRLSLVHERGDLQMRLRYNQGYKIVDKGYPTAPSIGGGFFMTANKIGQAVADGVLWQLPDYDCQPYTELTRPARKLAEAARDGSPCGCPYCERLRRLGDAKRATAPPRRPR